MPDGMGNVRRLRLEHARQVLHDSPAAKPCDHCKLGVPSSSKPAISNSLPCAITTALPNSFLIRVQLEAVNRVTVFYPVNHQKLLSKKDDTHQ